MLTLGNFAIGSALDIGDWDWAVPQIEELLQGPVPASEQAGLEASAALVAGYRGDFVSAERRIGVADELLQGITRREELGWHRVDQGRLLNTAGRFREAHELLMTVIDLSPSAALPAFGIAADAAAPRRASCSPASAQRRCSIVSMTRLRWSLPPPGRSLEMAYCVPRPLG
ncbi:MAG: hypothetical protein M3R49_00085 [Chloroflexota bacterium]|nr:hypothetical protein [Chloroflexota bacterium]